MFIFSDASARHVLACGHVLACLFLQPTCQACGPLWTCFGMFISSTAFVRYVLLFGHVLACLCLARLFEQFLACLFLQPHLSGMCSSLDMFRHVYFFSCTCQVCAALRTCFGMFISSAAPVRYVLLFRHVLACLFLQLHLSGMCSSLDMFWHVYFSSRTCQACTAFDTCFGTFISSLELARHVVPAEHVCFVLDNYWIG